MKIEQEQHLKEILKELVTRTDKKYRAGAKEHGGDLQDMSLRDLIENAIEESLDLPVYLLTALDKISTSTKD